MKQTPGPLMNKTSTTTRECMIAANLTEYGEHAQSLRWIDATQAAAAETRRAETLAALADRIAQACKQTKPHYGPLSPGCQICTQGQWSCLFINGRCNCRCFYCPTPQDDLGVPTTNLIQFAAPETYAEYAHRFGFNGVSISGGEPLLTYERAIAYIQAVRHKMGAAPHIWLYTNGTLVTAERLAGLKAAGLNEIRFDISAVDYNLEKARLAADVIDCLTVEIPAIPEDGQRLADLLPALSKAGVRHLNLHQLRLTPHNRPNLTQRNYTYLHGESVTVLESELTALELLRQACDQALPLAVNYCSFVYKRRYQKAAARRRSAQESLKTHEAITESGFIRTLALTGEPERIAVQAEQLRRLGVTPDRWTLNTKGDRLGFHPALWPHLELTAGRLTIGYAEAVLTAQVSYRCAFKEVRLSPAAKLYIEKRPLRLELQLDERDRDFFRHAVIESAPVPKTPRSPTQEAITDFEFIKPGLQDYF
ncbi:MAG: radical SAM protein [Desulfatitalea sp.]|nr:radical SAM protein [Desulfatitalea sp.]